jgi:hypothetical protein
MSIERSETIRFHEQGTLDAVTRWIATHHDGIAEWVKNVRRQYQIDRANVSEDHRVAVLLLKDGREGKPARIGVLDVGGATLEDVTSWSTWQDPTASHRGSNLDEEDTQGNGGKTYMYRLFTGPARIVGVKDRRRNCKGFDGDQGTVDRGTPGWIPSIADGRDVEISSFDAELNKVLNLYGVSFNDLPHRVRAAISDRQAFTLVEGENPTDLYKGRIDSDDLIAKVVRHEQSTLSLEQVDFYVFHNGRLLNEGKKLVLPPITPYPGLDSPVIHAIPTELPLDNRQMVSTNDNGAKENGRLTLHTSMENMPNAYKNLKPRWQIIYRTRHQMIGAKPISDLAPATPGAQFIYGTVELPALEPAYVEHGRRRPKDGPLVEALDRYINEKIRELAHQINSRRKQQLDEEALDQVHAENRMLDSFKNRFLPNYGEGNGGSAGGNGDGPRGGGGGGGGEWGTEAEALDYSIPEGGLHLGKGISVALRTLLEAKVRDANGRPVRAVIEWHSSDGHIAEILHDGMLVAREKGTCEIWGSVRGAGIQSTRMPATVWSIDHVLLTPRNLDIPLGSRQQIVAEVTDDEGRRSTNVLLEWRHDAEDPLIVRISQNGTVTGNRLGRTAITAGAGGVWARIPAEVAVIPNPEERKRGSGFPKLLLTGRDLDPATGTIREGDPDQPALWQEASDFVQNIWWLNLQSPEAAYIFRQIGANASLWRAFHAEKVVEMVVQVWMTDEFTRKGESERPEFWGAHRSATDRHRVRIVQQMWARLEPYISSGETGQDEEARAVR